MMRQTTRAALGKLRRDGHLAVPQHISNGYAVFCDFLGARRCFAGARTSLGE
jgi:hypothetical protein